MSWSCFWIENSILLLIMIFYKYRLLPVFIVRVSLKLTLNKTCQVSRAGEVLWDETGNMVAGHFGGQGSRRQSHCQS